MNREEEIRIIAHHMWNMEGRPEGKSLEYWLMGENIWEINHLSNIENKDDKIDRSNSNK